MKLARDLRMYDAAYGHSVLLRRGQSISEGALIRIMSLGFSGLYIDDGVDDDDALETGLPDELRTECITAIKSLFLSFKGTFDKQAMLQLDRLSSTVDTLINEIKNNEEFMINIVDLKMYDDYTYHHSLSVGVVSIAVGIGLELDNVYLHQVGLSAILHDIGKLMIPSSIIQKPSSLTEEEYELIKKHPMYGTQLLPHRFDVPETIFDGIRSHHERMDGSGYPEGLKEDEIPLTGRILAVADVYDALTSDRPYRAPSLPSEASEYIMGGTGSYFDENVVGAFVRKVAPYPVGTCVRLSNGAIAVVTKNDESAPLRPTVRLVNGNTVISLTDKKYLNIVINGLGYS
ncbi:MAG: HD-GYP domain-containing protein [Acetanaerobacterium sp.]